MEKDDCTILVFAWRYNGPKVQLNPKPPQCREGSETVTSYWCPMQQNINKGKDISEIARKEIVSNDKLLEKVLMSAVAGPLVFVVDHKHNKQVCSSWWQYIIPATTAFTLLYKSSHSTDSKKISSHSIFTTWLLL